MFAGLSGVNSARDVGQSRTLPSRRMSTQADTAPRPPFPQPLPHTRLRVVADEHGVHILGHRNPASPFHKRCLHLSYGKSPVVSILDHQPKPSGGSACEGYGCAGILKLFNESYLLLITSRKRVGNYAGSRTKRIYCLKDISAIPLSSQHVATDAVKAVAYANKTKAAATEAKKSASDGHSSNTSDASSDSSDGNLSSSSSFEDSKHFADEIQHGSPVALEEASRNVATIEDERGVVQTGRDLANRSSPKKPFWSFWSKRPEHEQSNSDHLVSLTESASPVASTSGISSQGGGGLQRAAVSSAGASDQPEELDRLRALDRKILRETIAELCNGGFFFSQDFDLTTTAQLKWEGLKREKNDSCARQASRSKVSVPVAEDVEIDLAVEEPRMSDPLSLRADKRFWWNRWLCKNISDSGAFEFITVLMQGYVQRECVRLCTKPLQSLHDNETARLADERQEGTPVRLLVISRRSTERSGLRYQRRGINDSGGVANFVETEFICTARLYDQSHLTSYVQIRGSIPLYWSQSPWSLKPIPVLERRESENLVALGKHFDRQRRSYSFPIHIVNLAEQTGKEGLLVKSYEDRVAALNRPDVLFHSWDFHHMCKGMRYERISLLLNDLERPISDIGSFWSMNGNGLAAQKGVFRVNCMDCLDRTNVVQSAFARQHLNTVLAHLGIGELEAASKESLDLSFNAIWANNGDAISRLYAGTSALKGDFVRSGKRNWRGQFNDATNSIARYWQNTVLDFFKQAVIDYVLGVNTNAFLEFSEKMQISDPGELTRLANIRQTAIDTTAAAVLTDEEPVLQGWTVLSPQTLGSVRDSHFEEKVVILTAKAIYACSYEFTLQKVREFLRIPLGQIVGIQQGEYVLSALDPSARNLEENYGFTLRYLPEGLSVRSRSYSMRNKAKLTEETEQTQESGLSIGQISFKAVRKDFIRDLEQASSPTTVAVSSRQQVLDIVEHIRQACEDVGATSSDDEEYIIDAPILSLAQAKAQVGYLERLNYEVKNLIWL